MAGFTFSPTRTSRGRALAMCTGSQFCGQRESFSRRPGSKGLGARTGGLGRFLSPLEPPALQPSCGVWGFPGFGLGFESVLRKRRQRRELNDELGIRALLIGPCAVRVTSICGQRESFSHPPRSNGLGARAGGRAAPKGDWNRPSPPCRLAMRTSSQLSGSGSRRHLRLMLPPLARPLLGEPDGDSGPVILPVAAEFEMRHPAWR